MGVALYRKSLLTEEVFAYILRFRTVNDRACFQKILEQQKNVSTYYSNRPSVLYRMSPSSLSNMNSPSRILHDKEIAQMCRFQRETEKSHIFRLLLLWQEKSTALRHGSNRYIRMLRFLSPYFLLMLWLYICRPCQLRAMERAQTDGEAARRLRRRVAELMPMWREMRELAALTARYYERSYHKNEKYTL